MASTVALLKTVKEGRPFSVNMQYRARDGNGEKRDDKLQTTNRTAPFRHLPKFDDNGHKWKGDISVRVG
jgi:hypothetical protein